MKKIMLLFISLVFTNVLFAQPIREVVFFGDSLSDNGNLYRKVKIIPKSPPYYAGQFSNGPVWSERLKDYLKITYGVASQNYAVGGATVIYRSIRKGSLPYYLKREIKSYLTSHPAANKNDVLYFLWMGGNDYIDEKEQPVNALVTDVIDEIILEIRTLIEHGGRNFVLFDLPDFSKAPFTKSTDQNAKNRMAKLSLLNHQKMLEAVELLNRSYPTLQFLYIDAYSIFNDMLANIASYNGRYHKHIINVTDSCWIGGYRLTNMEIEPTLQEAIQSSTALSIAYSVGTRHTLGEKSCDDPDNYLFWDTLHPTAATHDMLASIIAEKIETAFHFETH